MVSTSHQVCVRGSECVCCGGQSPSESSMAHGDLYQTHLQMLSPLGACYDQQWQILQVESLPPTHLGESTHGIISGVSLTKPSGERAPTTTSIY